MKLLTIENRTAKVKLNDAVTPWSVDELLGDIEKAYGAKAVAENATIAGVQARAEDALETLEITINSPGGSVLDGYRVYNALREMRSRGVKVVATVNTLAASMGSVILMAADERKAVEGARIMIHEAAQTVAGDSEDHDRAAKLLDSISDEIANIYAKATGGKKDDMRDLMKKETWMGADQAKALGFIHEIVSFDTPQGAMSILAKLFPGNSEVSALEAQIAESDSLRAQLTEALAKVEEIQNLQGVIAEKDLELANLTAKLSESKIETAKAEEAITGLTAEIEALTAKTKVTAEAISLEAARQLSATGHPEPVEINEPSSANPISKFSELKGDEAAEFFAKHKDQILSNPDRYQV
jgi:ATP-dependent Clp endopeptidase proteolytic subunit ClpP